MSPRSIYDLLSPEFCDLVHDISCHHETCTRNVSLACGGRAMQQARTFAMSRLP
ncbi:hypothetical protein K443DRAFT_670915 [Laccaria amethystina LaAM-08-1]|uniref:Uncharacterized protein n=1 Tax=Laccaria amethystina LaAM-08-1 TaxID=1095629 RepID=A0A0C9XDC8_9AGAR|nr:hypothetical protein K443DRAFT_670915 [Laccaria amethystina LaAM-08-1]